MSRENQPAQTYDLNMLASVLGRTQVRNLTSNTAREIIRATDEVIAILDDGKKPSVPHTEKQLLIEADKFVQKLRHMLGTPKALDILQPLQRQKITEILNRFEQSTHDLSSGPYQSFVTREDIEEMFQFYGMWESGKSELQADLERWGERNHPETSVPLTQPIDESETKKLIEVMKSVVLGIETPLFATIYLTNHPQDYHLYWSLTEEGSDYVTPANYGLDTQLSFDLPHNVAHLVHLSLLREHGVYGYIDDMATRAFFEAVAVFSEMEVVQKLENDPNIIEALSNVLDSKRIINPEELKKWMIADRSFEFRLRSTRLLADLLAIDGASLPEIVDIVSTTMELPYNVAEAEILKYFPWTGLGAIYTLGYRKLENSGIKSVSDVLHTNPPTTWGHFNDSSHKSI
jgi:hypothetical protein